MSWNAADSASGRTYSGYTGVLTEIIVSPDGTKLLSHSWDGEVWCWDVKTGSHIATFGANEKVYCMALSSDQRWFVTAAEDQTIEVWDFAQTQRRSRLAGHKRIVRHLEFNQAGTRLVSRDTSGELRVWSLTSGLCEQAINGRSDDSAMAFWSDDHLVIIMNSRYLGIWNLRLGKIEWQEFCGYGTSPYGSGGAVINTSEQIAVSFYPAHNRSGAIWDLPTLVTNAHHDRRSPAGPSRIVRNVVSSPDGLYVAAIVAEHGKQRVCLASLDAFTGQSRLDIGTELEGVPEVGLTGWIGGSGLPLRNMAIAFSPFSSRLAVATGEQVLIYNVRNGRRVGSLEAEEGAYHDASTIAFTPDGQALVLGKWFAASGEQWDADGGELQFCNAKSGRLLTKLEVDCPAHFAMLPNGRLACITSPGLVIFDTETRSQQSEIRVEYTMDHVAASLRGQFIAAVGKQARSGWTITVWDIDSREVAAQFPGQSAPITDLSFSPDGQWLVSVSEDGCVAIWDILAQTQAAGIDLVWPQYSCAFAANNGRLLLGGYDGITVIDWMTYR